MNVKRFFLRLAGFTACSFFISLLLSTVTISAVPLIHIQHYPKDTLPETDTLAKDTLVPDGKIFGPVEIEASFPGGATAWLRFLEQNLNSEVPVKRKNPAPVGAYTVMIQFVVDKNGNISDIKPLTNHGYGMEQEVMRILRKSPKWTPALQKGRTVKVYRKQPVTFRVEPDEEPKKKNRIT